MCGIVGFVGNTFSSNELLLSLKRLEYRGYDSFGYATNEGIVEKEIGEIKELPESACKSAVAHTRWSTHGGVTRENAHPHSDCSGNIFIVHNGIIENYEEMKEKLKGHEFLSETDSEVIAHYFEDKLKEKTMKEAVVDFFSEARGTFAILLIKKGDNNIYAFKRGSPLALGICDGKYIVASDIYAFSDKTEKAIFFHEDELAVINENGYEFFRVYDSILKKEIKEIKHIEWESTEEGKQKYEHFMLKEIYDEPFAAERLLKSLESEQAVTLHELKKMIQSSERVVFVAAGTSYHASLLGVYFLNSVGIEAHTLIASEFRNFSKIDENALVIAISQSGETMDVIEALHGLKEKGAKIASIVNVPYSTIQRMSNISINILAGQEVCVAATKTFVNQVIVLLKLASLFGYKNIIHSIPALIKKILEKENEIREIAKNLAEKKDIYIIGRGLSYPIAREIALKLKEISYIHAEGMMAGELKHGTIALIEQDTPVIALLDGNTHIISNAKEVEARGANVIALSSNSSPFNGIRIPSKCDGSFAILSAVAGQLLTYHIAKNKGLSIDKPRNLSKTITVL